MDPSNKLDVQIQGLGNFSKQEKEKFLKAIELCKKVVNSKEFKQKIKGYKWTSGGVTYNTFKKCEGLTNEEVYEKFMSGADKFHPEADRDIDLYTTLYYSRKGVVGYTYPNTFKTWINRKFFSSFNLAGIVGNIIHEYMHNMGFGHTSRYNSTRKHTVPYAYGYVARDIAQDKLDELSSGGNPENVPVNRKLVCRGKWIFRRCYWVVVD